MKVAIVTVLFCFGLCSAYGQDLKTALKAKDTVQALELLKKGADPNAKDQNGTTLLMEYCHFPDLLSAGFLLRHGAKPDEPRSPKGRTALMVACAYWCGLDMVKLLVNHGANINAVSLDGTTALMLAAGNEKQDVVDYLIAHGANTKAKNGAGKNALDYAQAGKVEDYMTKSIKDTRFNKDAVIASLEAAMK